MTEPFVLRPMRDLDTAFIRRTWVDSSKASYEGEYLGPLFYARKKAQVALTLADPSVTITVAHVPDDEDAILGWSARRGDCLLYRYVRVEARRQGIGKALVGDGIKAYAHRALRVQAPRDWKYRPCA